MHTSALGLPSFGDLDAGWLYLVRLGFSSDGYRITAPAQSKCICTISPISISHHLLGVSVSRSTCTIQGIRQAGTSTCRGCAAIATNRCQKVQSAQQGDDPVAQNVRCGCQMRINQVRMGRPIVVVDSWSRLIVVLLVRIFISLS